MDEALRARFSALLVEAEYTAEERKRYACVRRKKDDGGTEYKFPIGDEHHARLALQYLGSSDLTAKEKTAVISKATKYLGKKKVVELLKGKS